MQKELLIWPRQNKGIILFAIKYHADSLARLHYCFRDNAMIWNAFRVTGPFERGIGRSPVESSHKGSVVGSVDATVVVSLNKQAVEQTIGLLLIWDHMMLLWL